MTELLRGRSGVSPFYRASFIVAGGLRHVSIVEDGATRRASRSDLLDAQTNRAPKNC